LPFLNKITATMAMAVSATGMAIKAPVSAGNEVQEGGPEMILPFSL
jgi:hypothetical protein